MRPERGIVVSDLQRYLAGLADLQRDGRTGNTALAAAIGSLVDALKPYRSRPALDLPELLAGLAAPRLPKAAQRKPPVELPSGLTTLTGSAVEQVLADNRYLKSQLADLGLQRFGISRSRLCRLPKAEAVEAIRAALQLDAMTLRAMVALANAVWERAPWTGARRRRNARTAMWEKSHKRCGHFQQHEAGISYRPTGRCRAPSPCAERYRLPP